MPPGARRAWTFSRGTKSRAGLAFQPGSISRRPLRFQDEFEVRTEMGAVTRSTIQWAHVLMRGDTVIGNGTVTAVCVKKNPDGTMKSAPIPEEIISRLRSGRTLVRHDRRGELQFAREDRRLLDPRFVAQPKRLSGISYDQLAAYFVTAVTRNRVKAFDTSDFGPFVASALIDIATKFGFEVSAYVVMPDHVHFLVTAIEEGADFERMVKAWKQRTGFEWSSRHGTRLWQKGYWERVLRNDEASLSVCRYIVENPVRARLVLRPTEYELCGSTEYSIEEICEAVAIKGWWSGF